MPDIQISSLHGGLNDADFPAALAPDECAVANNVEFFYSALGERRLGTSAIDLSDSDLDENTTPVHLTERFPENNVETPEHWAVTFTPDQAPVRIAREFQGEWTPVAPKDPIISERPQVYQIRSQGLEGKLFFAYDSDENRLHVWDGTTLRRTGLAQPTQPPLVSGAF